jgi:hypothetical protein
MSGRRSWSRERRRMPDELGSALRGRLLRLDEPIDRSDWTAVVGRSRLVRRSRYRSVAVVATAAAVLAVAFGLGSARLFEGAGHPRAAAAPVRLALQLGDGNGLVLYSVASRTQFLDNPSERTTPETPAVARSLTSGPFHVEPAVFESGARQIAATPLPGDLALVSFDLFTTAGLQTPAGSAVLTCEYGADRTAYCNGAVDLENGARITASGTLTADVSHLTLVATSGYEVGHAAQKPRAATRAAPASGYERRPSSTAIKVLALSRHSLS